MSSFNYFSREASRETKIQDYSLPKFTVEEPVQPARAYVFTPLEGTGADPAMSWTQFLEKTKQVKRQAQAEADKILKEAAKVRAEAEAKGREQGLAEGRAKGREDGLAEAREAIRAELAPTVNALKNIENLYTNLWTANEAVLVKLAMKVAERVILQELTASPEIIQKAFRAAVDLLQEQHQVVFRVHPEDLNYLESISTELKDQIKGLVKVDFKPDRDLNRGDLIMETESGRLDATLKQRLEAVAGTVDDILKESFDLDW